MRAKLELPKDAEREEVERIALKMDNVRKHIEGRTVRKVIIVPNRIVNIVAT